MKDEWHIHHIVFIIFLALMFLFFSLGMPIAKEEVFSEAENRTLAGTPKITILTLLNGSFTEELRSFYSDRLPLRPFLLGLYSKTELALGKTEINDTVVAGDTLYQYPTGNESTLADNMEYYEMFRELMKEKNIPCDLLCIPDALSLTSDSSLPHSYLNDKSLELLHIAEEYSGVITPYDELISAKANGDTVTFRTDHHWTSLGAYIGYVKYAERIGLTPISRDALFEEKASDLFLGSSHSKTNIPSGDITPDALTLLRYVGDSDTKIFYHDTDTVEKGFYRFSRLDTKDKYSIFLGGNFAHLTVSSSSEKPRLLLIKDSYANAMIPFLAIHFDLDVIDPRYIHTKISEIIGNEDYDRVLLLFGIYTLSADTSLRKLIL